MEKLTLPGFLLRLGVAFMLVALTYNPSGHSFVHWVSASMPHVGPTQVIAGLILLGAWGFLVHATWLSLGTIGILLASALSAAFIWLFVSWGWFNLKDTSVMSWVALSALAIILSVGLSWSNVRRRLTGQTDVEQVGRH